MSKPTPHAPKKGASSKPASSSKKGGEINEKDLGKVSGGINPQPLPPRGGDE